MTGAEAAGLAVGVIALASLFTTCVELLDYVELGKNYLEDYRLACTKTNILHARLSIWGGAAHILHPGHEHPLLRVPAKRDAVGASLQSLKDVLSNTEILRRKYDLGTQELTLSTKDRARPQKFAIWSLNLRRRTTWSIRDKAKFDRFIEDVSFLMNNLEKVTETLGSSKTMSPISSYTEGGRQPNVMNTRAKLKMQDSSDDENQQDAAKDGQRSNNSTKSGSDPSASKERGSDTGKRSSKPTSGRAAGTQSSSLEFIDCVQKNSGSASGLVGIVGRHTGQIRFKGNRQDNEEHSKGVQGVMSEIAFVNEWKTAAEMERSDGED
jgi:hypothetical protein